jgi:mannose-6-phosphate isomerase
MQSHPDKSFAPILHANFPQHYKDPNHKPEMVVAVTPFEAMCGFRSLNEIYDNLLQYPELRALIGEDAFNDLGHTRINAVDDAGQRAVVKKIFCGYMTCGESEAAVAIASVVERLAALVSTEEGTDIGSEICDEQTFAPTPQDIMKLILRLHADYPGDRGILAPLLLNVIYLKPGQSFFMGPNEPHAYLFGDCVECMALSDNVVRAGLTPKFRHVDVLCGMLHYKYVTVIPGCDRVA